MTHPGASRPRTATDPLKTAMPRGLPPRVGRRLEVLILGSFPGERSLAERRYYAHPQNRFWPTLGAHCGFDADAPYEARVAGLHARGLGLWDVLASCDRRGSLDQRIVRGTEVPNPLGDVTEAHPELRAILLNGRSVAELFHRHQLPRDLWDDTGVRILVMPSTSPAHARMRPGALAAAWHDVLAALAPRA